MKERDPQKNSVIMYLLQHQRKKHEHKHRPNISYHQFLNDNV
jgi:hypothetical protein